MSSIQVIAAVYGAIQGSKDVTQAVQYLVNSGSTSFTANNDTFGDPAHGYSKHFGICYTLGGSRYTIACAEDQTVNLTSGTQTRAAGQDTEAKSVNA